MRTYKLELDEEQAILVRDALTDQKHALKNSPSERGQKLSRVCDAIATELRDKIRTSR